MFPLNRTTTTKISFKAPFGLTDTWPMFALLSRKISVSETCYPQTVAGVYWGNSQSKSSTVEISRSEPSGEWKMERKPLPSSSWVSF